MKLGVIFTLIIFASSLYAEVSVNIKCLVRESNGASSTKISSEVVTLSSEGRQSLAITPMMSIDRSSIFVVNLSKGHLYLDALGDEEGQDNE